MPARTAEPPLGTAHVMDTNAPTQGRGATLECHVNVFKRFLLKPLILSIGC